MNEKVLEEPPDLRQGYQIERLNWLATSLFTLVAILAAIEPSIFVFFLVPVSCGGFLVGFIAFTTAYFKAIGRSRVDAIGMGGLYFLTGSAPKRVRNTFAWALAVQIIVGFVVASIHPFTPVAFSLLMPLCSLGLSGYWGATYGVFSPRVRPKKDQS